MSDDNELTALEQRLQGLEAQRQQAQGAAPTGDLQPAAPAGDGLEDRIGAMFKTLTDSFEQKLKDVETSVLTRMQQSQSQSADQFVHGLPGYAEHNAAFDEYLTRPVAAGVDTTYEKLWAELRESNNQVGMRQFWDAFAAQAQAGEQPADQAQVQGQQRQAMPQGSGTQQDGLPTGEFDFKVSEIEKFHEDWMKGAYGDTLREPANTKYNEYMAKVDVAAKAGRILDDTQQLSGENTA